MILDEVQLVGGVNDCRSSVRYRCAVLLSELQAGLMMTKSSPRSVSIDDGSSFPAL